MTRKPGAASAPDKSADSPQSTRHARGTFNPVVYFENYRGVIALPPTTADALRIKDAMAAKGFRLLEAATISHVQDLQRRIAAQEIAIREGRLEREEHLFAQQRRERRDRLLTRRNSSDCSPYERDAIDAHLKLMDEKHAAKVAEQRKEEYYFESLEFDASSHHLLDSADKSPNMQDEQCTRCKLTSDRNILDFKHERRWRYSAINLWEVYTHAAR